MFENLMNNDLIITNNKKAILKYLSNHKKLLNLRIMNLNEFKNAYFGTYNEKAIYYLINKYGYKYDVAKMYLDNFLFDENLKTELENNNLIIINPLFKNSIKRIVIDNVVIDKYILNEIEKYENINLKYEIKNFNNPIYEFDNLEEEVNFVCISILKLLSEVSINDIYLVNITDEYLTTLERMFKFYKIPLNLNVGKNIYGTYIVQKFLNKLKQFKDFSKALEDLPKNEITDSIINVCNKYVFTKVDDVILYLIEEELKSFKLKSDKLDNAVNVKKIDEIDSSGHYFILGFNQGVLPVIYKNEDYFSDLKKEKFGILTSLEKNKKEKEKIAYIIKSFSNLTISYKLKSNKEDFYRSSLIDDLGLKVQKLVGEDFGYSNIYNKLCLARKLDNLIKFNEHNSNLELLYSNYSDIPYLTYNNKYKKITNELFYKYINDNLLLSYSSIDNYYRCGFRYYVSNILKLNKYEETFMTYIGNLFHYILSIAFNDNFDFEYEFNNYIKDKNFTSKELFFINKLKNDLLFTIEIIKKQDNYTNLNNALYEQKIYVSKDRNIKITFMGIIDKIKSGDFDGKKIIAIIDYKTGNPDIDLNNLVYGISMQLPIYLYLAKNSFENVEIAGIYLQKIIHNKLLYQPNKDYFNELSKNYRLEGYSNNDVDVLSKLDNHYADNSFIKGMKTSSKGFYPYTKILNEQQIDNIYNIVDDKINKAIDGIINTNFDINPKKIDKDLLGCEFCKFKDICYRKEEDVVNLQPQNYKDFLGGDIDA